MTCFNKIIFCIVFFPVGLQAQGSKIGLEWLRPLKSFHMKVGEPVKIQFEAATSSSHLFYGIVLKSGSSMQDGNETGPLMLEAHPLKQGVNEFIWDGESYGAIASNQPALVKMNKSNKGFYYFKLLVFETSKVQFVGRDSNDHIKSIASLRTINFQIR